MAVQQDDVLALRSSEDIVAARQLVRSWAVKSGFSLVDQTKIVTAASELARNALIHGGGGEMRIELLQRGPRCGLQLIFSDQGPGIRDMELAMTDGYTTAGGMGLGLGGSKRLMNEFSIESKPGAGTRVTVVRWR
jgi:serine/threonine-protein kinase RsbT